MTALKQEMSFRGLTAKEVHEINWKYFIEHTYEQWYSPKPEDIVVDLGAKIGAFGALALDNGADELYMVETNKEMLKTAWYNISNYLIDRTDKKIQLSSEHIGREISFKDWLKKYEIDFIDYLKIEPRYGFEYAICTKEYLDFCKNNVRHIAVTFDLSTKRNIERFEKSREEFIRAGWWQQHDRNWNDLMHQQCRYLNDVGAGVIWRSLDLREFAINNKVLTLYLTNY